MKPGEGGRKEVMSDDRYTTHECPSCGDVHLPPSTHEPQTPEASERCDHLSISLNTKNGEVHCTKCQGRLCGCGHVHIVSVGDFGSDVGCERLGHGCDCWNWHSYPAA
jgi:hypothetical protein